MAAVVALIPLCSGIGIAETVRVTAWDLPDSTAPGSSEAINKPTAYLRLLNPDIILLSGVKTWTACSEITEALKPNQYTIAICSSFRDGSTGRTAARQVAVLSKHRPYFSWSEQWQSTEEPGEHSGGFAFVAVQAAKQRLGFYCVDFKNEPGGSNAVRQLLQHLATVKRWEANAVQTITLGGPFSMPGKQQQSGGAVGVLLESGVADACFDLFPRGETTSSSALSPAGEPLMHLLAERSAFGINPQEDASSGQRMLTCDLELDPAKVATGWPTRAQELERRSLARRAAENRPSAAGSPGQVQKAPGLLPRWWWLAFPTGFLIVGAWWGLSRLRHRPRSLPAGQTALLPGVEGSWVGSSSYTVVIAPESVEEPGNQRSRARLATSPAVSLESTLPSSEPVTVSWPPNILPADEASRASLLADLGRWLKQTLVRRLVSDRRQLLKTQEDAALKARAVDERLSRIEQQIHQQTRDYERRIEELTLELLASKEENRDLIQARIAQVKLEMAAVRAKALARVRKENPQEEVSE